MKANHITDATKILLLAAATTITCITIWIGISAMNTAKELSSTAINQISKLNNDLKDSDIKIYDGTYVTGSEVVNFIKKNLGDYKAPELAPIYVYVITDIQDAIYVDGNYISNIRNFADNQYIKPTAKFLGEVVENENDIIIGVKFEQK